MRPLTLSEAVAGRYQAIPLDPSVVNRRDGSKRRCHVLGDPAELRPDWRTAFMRIGFRKHTLSLGPI